MNDTGFLELTINTSLARYRLHSWQQVHDLRARNVGLLDCARRLSLSLNTVKRYDRASERERLQRRARTGDLLQITKALLIREITTLALPLARRPSSCGSCPSECSSRGAYAHRFRIRIMRLTRVELSGLEPLTSCMP